MAKGKQPRISPELAGVIASVTGEFIKFIIDMVQRRMAGQEIGDKELTFRIRGTSKQQLLYEAAKAARGVE